MKMEHFVETLRTQAPRYGKTFAEDDPDFPKRLAIELVDAKDRKVEFYRITWSSDTFCLKAFKYDKDPVRGVRDMLLKLKADIESRVEEIIAAKGIKTLANTVEELYGNWRPIDDDEDNFHFECTVTLKVV